MDNLQEDNISEKLDEFDKRLIAQEHRVFKIVSNIFKYAVQEPDAKRLEASGRSLVSYILTRQTAVIIASVSAGLISLAALFISYQSMQLLGEQNDKIERQNDRLIQQNQLAEAERRSSLVFLFNNIMDALDSELKEAIDKKSQEAHARKLSPQLIGRLIALSRRLEPYRSYDYDYDNLGPLLSPERGQLLINLLESRIDTVSLSKIYNRGNFSYANLEGYSNTGAYLKGINLSRADLKFAKFKKANLRNAKLDSADLEKCELQYSDLSEASLRRTRMHYANLDKAYLHQTTLDDARLYFASFEGAKIIESEFGNTYLRGANFENAQIEDTGFEGADMQESNLMNAKILNSYFEGTNLSYTVFHHSTSDTSFMSHEEFIDSLFVAGVTPLRMIDRDYKLEKVFLHGVLSSILHCEFLLVHRDSTIRDHFGGILVPEDKVIKFNN